MVWFRGITIAFYTSEDACVASMCVHDQCVLWCVSRMPMLCCQVECVQEHECVYCRSYTLCAVCSGMAGKDDNMLPCVILLYVRSFMSSQCERVSVVSTHLTVPPIGAQKWCCFGVEKSSADAPTIESSVSQAPGGCSCSVRLHRSAVLFWRSCTSLVRDPASDSVMMLMVGVGAW
jgi:hypothetical protein